MALRHKHHDKFGKNLLRFFPQATLGALGLRFGRKPIRFEDVAINVPEHAADGVIIVGAADDPERYALLVEYETRPKVKNRKDWFYKTGALGQQLGMEVILLVVYLRRGNYRSFPTEYTVERDGLVQTFTFNTVCLWELVPRIRSGELRALAPALLVCEGSADVAKLSEVRTLIEGGGFTGEDRNNLLAMAASLASLSLSQREIQKVMASELRLLRRSPLLREWMQESESLGLEKGKAIGREEGMELGREEGMELGREEGMARGVVSEARNSLLRLLDRRFGPLAAEVVEQVGAGDLEWCRVTHDRAIDAGSLAELGLSG